MHLYHAEHRELSALLGRLHAEIEMLPGIPVSLPYLIGLMEREKTLKGVTGHHQTREERDL